MIVSARKLKKNDVLYIEGRRMVVRKVKKTSHGETIYLAIMTSPSHVFKLYVPKHYTVRLAR